MKNRWIAVLELDTLGDALKLTKADEIYAGMAGNAYFPAPDPSMADFHDQITKTRNSYNASRNAGTEETAIFHNDIRNLENMMTSLVNYVNIRANKPQYHLTGDVVILSAAMKVKEESEINIQDFSVVRGTLPGTVFARAKAMSGKVAYIWQFVPHDGGDFVSAAVTVKATYLFTGLDSERKYKFRMAIVTKDGQGAWSVVLILMVL